MANGAAMAAANTIATPRHPTFMYRDFMHLTATATVMAVVGATMAASAAITMDIISAVTTVGTTAEDITPEVTMADTIKALSN